MWLIRVLLVKQTVKAAICGYQELTMKRNYMTLVDERFNVKTMEPQPARIALGEA